MKQINIDKIESEFEDGEEDRYFIELFKKHLKGEVKVARAVLLFKDIVPFSSECKPKLTPSIVDSFVEEIRNSDYPYLHVYYKDGKYIMSDNYFAYYLYKEFGFSEVLCNVYGEAPDLYKLKRRNMEEKKLDKILAMLEEINLRVAVIESKFKLKERVENPGWKAEDDLFEEAKQVVIAADKASAALIQRRLQVGYARAARLLDILEQEGVVGPSKGDFPREVLVKE